MQHGTPALQGKGSFYATLTLLVPCITYRPEPGDRGEKQKGSRSRLRARTHCPNAGPVGRRVGILEDSLLTPTWQKEEDEEVSINLHQTQRGCLKV